MVVAAVRYLQPDRVDEDHHGKTDPSSGMHQRIRDELTHQKLSCVDPGICAGMLDKLGANKLPRCASAHGVRGKPCLVPTD